MTKTTSREGGRYTHLNYSAFEVDYDDKGDIGVLETNRQI